MEGKWRETSGVQIDIYSEVRRIFSGLRPSPNEMAPSPASFKTKHKEQIACTSGFW